MAWQLDITALVDLSGIRVVGEVDTMTLPIWQLALDVVCNACGDIVIDLVEVSFIDASGLEILAVAAMSMRSQGRRTTLRATEPSFRRHLDLLGWSELFAFERDAQPAA